MLSSKAQAGQAYAFDTPPLVTPQPAYLQPHFTGGPGGAGHCSSNACKCDPCQTTLQDLGLLDIFPYLAMGLSGDKLEPVQQNPGSNYLAYIGLLNQVVMMGTQLYHDASVPQHHKYAAHQIALLYQCLNMLQGDTKPIRRIVEGRFDEIKVVTESKDPFLPVELSAWIQEITWLCREEVQHCPPYIHKRLDELMRAARGLPQQQQQQQGEQQQQQPQAAAG